MQLLRHKRLTTFILSLAVLMFALPRLPLQLEMSLSSWFAFTWLAFAILVIAANWRSALGVDREEQQQLERIKNLKTWQWEERVRGGKRDYPRADRQRLYRRNVQM
ncbi:hypothetical protein [Novibacillus thermophilus]|nr:hypothetical protein [Novibacillus thermophilus]